MIETVTADQQLEILRRILEELNIGQSKIIELTKNNLKDMGGMDQTAPALCWS